MKIVIAPDSFKESISAPDAAKALAEGVLSVCPQAQIDLCPMADGGEGMVEAMVAATAGRFETADVFDPLGRPIRAKFGMLGATTPAAMLPGMVALQAAEAMGDTGVGGKTAVIEMAAASGLMLVKTDLRNPLRTTTFGTGQLILAALEIGATKIILGIGGSATVDGGAGAAQALGAEFFDADGEAAALGIAGGGLADIARIDTTNLDPRLAEVDILIACDVENPLSGPEGAAAIFGPQKGATPEGVALLQAGLSHYAAIIREQLGKEIETLPGSGAAGGLGAGLLAFTSAKLVNGGKLVAEAVDLSQRLVGADLCITGEGKLDGQSVFGKTPIRVADTAGKQNVPTACIAGLVTDDAPRERFCQTVSLVGDDATKQQAILEPAPLLAKRAAAVMQEFIK